MRRIDLTGQKFGRLTVIERAKDYIQSNGKHRTTWRCQCNCGNQVVIRTDCLLQGDTQSCGCYKNERMVQGNQKFNNYEICGNCVTMYTSKGEPFDIDLDDLWRVKEHCWVKRYDGYIVSVINRKTVRLHRFVMNAPDNMIVDHIHHDTTDNRKCELRLVTRSQNNMNRMIRSDSTSGITGVTLHKRTNKWVAQLCLNDKHIHLGYFDNKEDAVKARKQAEEEYFGEYSYNQSMLHREGVNV